MRFIGVPNIIFTDVNGVSYTIKDTRPVSVFKTGNIHKLQSGYDIDEIISRKEYYGDGAEDKSWAVVDHNLETITERDFDLTRLKEIRIPVIEGV
jgi:hypothetical protein